MKMIRRTGKEKEKITVQHAYFIRAGYLRLRMCVKEAGRSRVGATAQLEHACGVKRTNKQQKEEETRFCDESITAV